MQFAVFIPATEADGFDVSLRVEADNWMQALKLGLSRSHNELNPVRNVFCDIRSDELIHVTDLASQRVFKIRRLPDEEPLPPEAQRPAPVVSSPTMLDATARAPSRFRHPREFPAIDARRPPSTDTVPDVPKLLTGEDLGILDDTGRFRAISRREIGPNAPAGPSPIRVVEENVMPTAQRMKALRFDPGPEDESGGLAETTLEEVFLEVTGLFEGQRTLESAVRFALDLSMSHVPAESGAILFASEDGTSLYFAAARGPKADELLDGHFTLSIEQGIAGFCTRTGVSLAVLEAARDPRFFADVSKALGYEVTSVLCAPIQYEGRSFGALELVNHPQERPFSSSQINVLTYVAGQLGRFITRSLAA